MNLRVHPNEIIPAPSFTAGKEGNKHIAEQWKNWKASVKHVHDVFGKLMTRKKSFGTDTDSLKGFIGTLRMSPSYVQKYLRDEFSFTAAVSGEAIIEAARRFVERETVPEEFREDIDEKGFTEWERDLL